jgi:hypothetical protein
MLIWRSWIRSVRTQRGIKRASTSTCASQPLPCDRRVPRSASKMLHERGLVTLGQTNSRNGRRVEIVAVLDAGREGMKSRAGGYSTFLSRGHPGDKLHQFQAFSEIAVLRAC